MLSLVCVCGCGGVCPLAPFIPPRSCPLCSESAFVCTDSKNTSSTVDAVAFSFIPSWAQRKGFGVDRAYRRAPDTFPPMKLAFWYHPEGEVQSGEEAEIRACFFPFSISVCGRGRYTSHFLICLLCVFLLAPVQKQYFHSAHFSTLASLRSVRPFPRSLTRIFVILWCFACSFL